MTPTVDPHLLTHGVAIIGLAGRFPGAGSVERFWENIRDGVESISFFSEAELRAFGVDPRICAHPQFVPAKGVVEDADRFDAGFFGFNPREAAILDPQHRLFLECGWESLEHAGYDPERYQGSIGVYAGVGISAYLLQNLATADGGDLASAYQLITGNDKDFFANRLSYKLGLRGPSITVQSACSTSLVAVHMACQSLLTYQCDMALAGGASVGVPQHRGYVYQEGMILSRDGHCRAFDRHAAGTVPGEGVGIVVLKRLSEALEDGDQIYAVIRGTAVNNDGALKAGYTAPSIEGQAEVIATAQAVAEVEPGSITYVETHGTGTPLGDPIEMAALTKAFRVGTRATGFCAIGSLKTNVGHLDAAAGVASLIKTAMALRHRQLPPSLHFAEPNPQVALASSPFFVNQACQDWNAGQTPRRAGVSSFGIGGTNAHAIVQEAPPRESSGPSRKNQLLVLSARTPEALDQATASLATHLKSNADVSLADVAYTLQTGRKSFAHRRTVLCDSVADAVKALESLDPKRVRTAQADQGQRAVAFMFPGQGAQYVDMARGLYDGERVFREHVDACAGILRPHLGFDLRDLIYPNSKDGRRDAAAQLTNTAVTQPAMFAIEYALARLWMTWGVTPDAMIGHSIGEYVAACLAGVFTLEDALRLVSARGRLMQQLPAGAMLAVALSPDAVQDCLSADVSLAAVNAPAASVLSGPIGAIDAVERMLSEHGTPGRRLATSHAFHSAMMTPILEQFEAEIRGIALQAPSIRFISNVTGTWITAAEATDPRYWVSHLRGTVRFMDGLQTLAQDPNRVMLEVGPGHTLSSLARRQVPAAIPQIGSLRHPDEPGDDVPFVLNALGQLWRVGVRIDWSSFSAGERRMRVPLPTYPFDRQRYWVEPGRRTTTNAQSLTTEKKPDVADWFYLPSWKHSAPADILAQDNRDPASTRWLMLCDETGVAAALAARLATRGHNPVTVAAGERFTRLSDNTFVINPGERADYFDLLKTLAAEGALPDRVVHAWSLTAPNPGVPERDRIESATRLGFYSLLYLAQALAQHAVGHAARVDVIVNQAHAVTGSETLRPEAAITIGPVKVIPQEYPNLTCRLVDIEAVATSSHDWSLVDHLVQEMEALPSDFIVAYRHGRRWVQSFESVRLEDPAARPPRLRPSGVYLITGGLGKIGLALAEYLATTFQAKLILVGRSPLPDRTAWPAWLTSHPADDETSRKIARLHRLEEQGAEVLVVSADVSRPDDIRRAVATAHARFKGLHGVFHLAGVGLAVEVPDATKTSCEAQFSPKIAGLCALTTALSGARLDFAVVTSSLSSILGGLGFAAYAAANAFVDAYAHRTGRDGGIRWRSVNWDGWDFAEPETDANTPGAGLEKLDLRAHEGIEAWKRVLALEGVPQIAVSTGDLHCRLAKWVQPRSAADDVAAAGRSLHARPSVGAAYEAPRSDMEREIAGIWQDVLGIADVGIHDNFFELGGHSLLATQVVSRIRQRYRVELPLRKLFEASTVADNADYLSAIMCAADAGGETLDRIATDREEIQL